MSDDEKDVEGNAGFLGDLIGDVPFDNLQGLELSDYQIDTSTYTIDFANLSPEQVEMENVEPWVYDEVDATPNEELRDLIARLRHYGGSGENAYLDCANELESLLGEHDE